MTLKPFFARAAKFAADRPGVPHAALALAVSAAVLLAGRGYLTKLADTTLVFADAAGFAECAAAHPLGCVDWWARLLAATGLTWAGVPVLLALVALAQFLTSRAARVRTTATDAWAAWLPALLVVLPILGLGEDVWLLTAPHFIHANLLWYCVAAGLCAALGRWGLLAAAAVPLAAAVVGRLCWGDLPWNESVTRAFPIRPTFTWKPFCWASVLALAGLAALVLGPSRRLAELLARHPTGDARAKKLNALFLPPLFLLFATLCTLAPRDARDQLKMERRAIAGDFAGVLQVNPKKARPWRMETAWRLLALYRLDRLDHDLWRFPMPDSYQNTDEEEMIMEGPELLFQYGLVLPARRWVFESCMVKGWQPAYYRLLGNVALITGEAELAKKNFRQLARCPFRGDAARRRLEVLNLPTPPNDAFSDLADVAGMYDVWRGHAEATKTIYFGNDRVVERFVYTLFLSLQSCPPPMLKMFFSCALLDGHPELLRDNREAVTKLYPHGNVGPVFLEVLK